MSRKSKPVYIKLRMAGEAVIAVIDDPLLSDPAEEPELRNPCDTCGSPKKKARNRITYDLSEELEEAILAVANSCRTSQSQVAALLLLHGLKAISTGEINIASSCKPSNSLKFENRIDLPEINPVYLEGRKVYPVDDVSPNILPEMVDGDKG